MESTGIYWNSVHAHLENAGIAALAILPTGGGTQHGLNVGGFHGNRSR